MIDPPLTPESQRMMAWYIGGEDKSWAEMERQLRAIEEQSRAGAEAQLLALRSALHVRMGYDGEGIGVWLHRPDNDGTPEQRDRFYTFRVGDVHAAIDAAFDREPTAPSTTESNPEDGE